MPKKPSSRPSFHKASGYWVRFHKRQTIYLSKNENEALRLMRRQLLREAQEAEEKAAADEPLGDTPLFTAVVAEMLDDLQHRKSPSHYEGMWYRLQRAMKYLEADLLINEVRQRDLARMEREMRKEPKFTEEQIAARLAKLKKKATKEERSKAEADMRAARRYTTTSINDTISAVQAVCQFAVARDYLEASPLARYRKPNRHGRERIITPDEFQAMLRAAASNRPFQRVLIACWRTGARPAEIRGLVWRQVTDDGFWVIEKHKTKETARDPRPRVFPLDPCLVKLCAWIRQRTDQTEPADPVFLSCDSLKRWKPWTKNALCRAMRRVRERAGLTEGEAIVLYSNRHTFGTNAAGKIDPFELAGLMGHTSIKTTQRYVHLNRERIAEAAQKLRDGGRKRASSQARSSSAGGDGA